MVGPERVEPGGAGTDEAETGTEMEEGQADLIGAGLVAAPGADLSPEEEAKARAARAALTEVRSGMDLGLGTGSTVRHFLDALGEALASGQLTKIRGVPTSEDTARRAAALGIPMLALHESPRLDLAIDGADEVTPALDLIKGLGGALLREKMVVQRAARFIVIVDDSKRVAHLGEKAPLPVEVVPFGWEAHLDALSALGGEPRRRTVDGTNTGAPFVTDNGNFILDVWFPEGIRRPDQVEEVLQRRAGIVDSGLFLGLAHAVYVAAPPGIEILRAPREEAAAP
jgi:ribose 5-phosphate isomerase A